MRISGQFFYLSTGVLLFLFASSSAYSQTVRFNPTARTVIETRLEKYGGNNAQREASLKQMFAEAGCDGKYVSEQIVKGSKLPNLICVQPGNTEKVIIVGAHYDHVSAGDGVVDNWSGASLLPSLYEALKAEPHKHTFIFIGFTDEEKGEIGSRYYARQMTKEQVAATEAMVNMDTLGLATTKIWLSHSDKRLANLLVHVARQLNFPIADVDVDRIGSTDSVQFSARKIPSITIHSLTQETWNAHILHTSQDKLSAVRLDDYYQTYRLISGYLAFLDASL